MTSLNEDKRQMDEVVAAKEHLEFAIERLRNARRESENMIDREVLTEMANSACQLQQRAQQQLDAIAGSYANAKRDGRI